MKTLYLLFSHTLTEEQKTDACLNLGVNEFMGLTPNLQQLFSNVPANLETLDEYLTPICEWISEKASNKQDYILIQGDFGVTYYLVNYCKKFNYASPIYATTERQIVEVVQENGSITTQRVFKHRMFRKY